VLAINGQEIKKGSSQIRMLIGLLQVGDTASIDIMRGEDHKTIEAVIGKPKRPEIAGNELHPTLQGASLTATPKDQVEGVLIEKIEPSSYAWNSGLRTGDIIVSVNRYRIRNLDEFKQVVNPRQPLLINLQRGGEGFFVVLK
jgi:serine protease Do/serine protease DegQ